jgi:hypothetical protein
MSRFFSKLLTRRETGGDRTLAVSRLSHKVGRMQVFPVPLRQYNVVLELPTSLGMMWGAESAGPQMLRRLHVCNATASQATIRLAVMTTPSGSPAAGNTFLLWDVPVAAGTMFDWQGQVPFIGRWLYGSSSVAGCSLYLGWEYLTP